MKAKRVIAIGPLLGFGILVACAADAPPTAQPPRPAPAPPATTQQQPVATKQTSVQMQAADGVTVFGDYYAAANPRALILLFHQAGSNRGEYATIAPRLLAAGYSTLAIDQRSGDGMFGARNATVEKLGHSGDYLDAEKDLEAALAWAHADGRKAPVLVWGSSYSAALVFLLAAKHPEAVSAVLAFSPGEYLGQPHMVRDAAGKISVPVYVTSAKDAEEIASARQILDAVASKSTTLFVPKVAGIHGSSTLHADRNAKGMEENWRAVMTFLDSLNTSPRGGH